MTIEEIKKLAAQHGYELRHRGSPRGYVNAQRSDGTPILDYFHPHIRMRASEYARTRKVYELFRQQVTEHFGRELATDSDIYRHYLLLMLEHCARELKIKGNGIKVVTKMMLPLPREEWLRPAKKVAKVVNK